MGQGRRGMAQGHRSHATGMCDCHAMYRDHWHYHCDMSDACTGASARFAAIGGRSRVRLERLCTTDGAMMLRRLHAVVARHCRLGIRRRCDRYTHCPMFDRMHLHHLHGCRGRAGPVEHQGNAQQQAQHDGAKGHDGYFTLPGCFRCTGNMNSRPEAPPRFQVQSLKA